MYVKKRSHRREQNRREGKEVETEPRMWKRQRRKMVGVMNEKKKADVCKRDEEAEMELRIDNVWVLNAPWPSSPLLTYFISHPLGSSSQSSPLLSCVDLLQLLSHSSWPVSWAGSHIFSTVLTLGMNFGLDCWRNDSGNNYMKSMLIREWVCDEHYWSLVLRTFSGQFFFCSDFSGCVNVWSMLLSTWGRGAVSQCFGSFFLDGDWRQL